MTFQMFILFLFFLDIFLPTNGYLLPNTTLRLAAEFSGGMYHLEFSMGKPPKPVKAVLDTGSSLSWIMCDPRGNPIYNPKTSKTYHKIACKNPLCELGKYAENCTEFCTYSYTYNDGHYIKGTLVNETLSFGKIEVPNMVIGCSTDTNLLGEPGIMGFGLTNFSLVGQLGLTQFSICLSSKKEVKSHVFFGSLADIKKGSPPSQPILTVPIVSHSNKSSDYWVALKAISIGKTYVETSWEATVKPNGEGLIAVDTGSDMCSFAMATYNVLKQAFKDEVKLPMVQNYKVGVGEGICFQIPAGKISNESSTSLTDGMPMVVYHLDGVDMKFSNDRFYEYDEKEKLVCVKIRGMKRKLSLWGNYQMKNMHILFDLKDMKLSFAHTQCHKL
ncbi:hypothetical protein ZOSMA_74G00800 [Zostera marina]|uniref:Peptidase A1 domain-containing protein n=1 Tax=Zostera marina TaxID=29655 RepID=A0A0K9NPQ4_ZOSMR|nr:hypothetical protein ZOSMA_74G00800 [Zostera marina]